MINFCSNFFKKGTYLNEKFGYIVVIIEPFIEEKEKNFDIAIFNRENNTLMLVECKHSLSNISKDLNNIEKSIEVAERQIENYEEKLGNKIDNIEYVLCTHGNNAHVVADKIFEKNLPIITWACSFELSELELFISRGRETPEESYENNRIHHDLELNRELFNGVNEDSASTLTFKITPSIDDSVILSELNNTLKIMINNKEIKMDDFDYSTIFHIIEKELYYSTYLEEDIERITDRIIRKAIDKEIFEYLGDEFDSENMKNNRYKFKISTRSGKSIHKKTEENYIEFNAIHKAEKDAIEDLENSGRLPRMDRFLQ